MINVAVEGASDEGAARAIVHAAGHEVGVLRVARGKNRLDPLIPKYNQAAAWTPWIVFRDSDGLCPVDLRTTLTAGMPEWNPGFLLRIAHTMTEAWLMADADSFAEYFSVSRARVPREPEEAPNGKRALLGLCAKSRSSRIRKDMLREDGQSGSLYVPHLNTFASGAWRPEVAAERSPSLARALRRIREVPHPEAGDIRV